MTGHGRVRLLLYDYVCNDLVESDRAIIEHHLSLCERCRKECEEIREVIQILPEPGHRPSNELPEEYWSEFARGILDAVPAHRRGRPGVTHPLSKLLAPFGTISRRFVPVFATLLILLGAGYLSWKLSSPPDEPHDSVLRVTGEEGVYVPEDRFGQYLRKSKVLLVGMTNMPAPEGVEMDVTQERRLSRELIREARYLRRAALLDLRSTLLIEDLDKILITLANTRQRENRSELELLRGGIRRENLLFKIRMAENLRDSVYAMHAVNVE
jgi:hypothetical protein